MRPVSVVAKTNVHHRVQSLLDSMVRIIGAEDLIAMKIFAGGVQDLIDVRGILKVSQERLDLELLRNLTRRYGSAASRKLDELLKA
jgi:hypothetical protein